jgi:AcrR family transcriptional regulator
MYYGMRRRLTAAESSVKIGCTAMDTQKTPKRKYEMKQRAADIADTRRRITEAAVELHGTIGPARTTISAVADRAGVQRHTVYRHFPTEDDLFEACSSQFYEAHPRPDKEAWRSIDDPRERLQRALDELYGYYERTGHMYANVLRDEPFVESIGPRLAGLRAYLSDAAVLLALGWGARGRRRRLLDAALAHVLAFETWRSLSSDGGLTRTDAVELAVGLVDAVA